MLDSGFTSVLLSRTRDEFQAEVVSFTKRLGFDTVSATVVIDHLLGDAEFITVDNTPRGFRDIFEDPKKYRRDPVMQHCKKQSMPIIWDQSTYAENGVGEMWEVQARFGYCSGIAMALHLPDGRHFFLGGRPRQACSARQYRGDANGGRSAALRRPCAGCGLAHPDAVAEFSRCAFPDAS
jgi:hypothetical protein